MLARAVAHISRQSLHHNLSQLATRAGVPLLLPVKADAYGHGIEVMAPLAAAHPGVWGLAVATPQEAQELAHLNLGKPVVLLTPAAPEEIPELVALGVRIPVGSLREAELLPPGARAHLKVNTGMNRLGARPEEAVGIGQFLAKRGMLEGAYTHYASADEPDLSFAGEQFRVFQGVLAQLPPLLAHSSNGGGILSWGTLPGMALARPGLASYGFTPAHLKDVLDLQPVMTLQARVNYLHTIQAGESVSYNNLWTAQRETVVAVLGVGYADGYPRNATLKASVLIGGEQRPVLGRICMDQMMVDVTGLRVQVGDWAELWGRGPITVTDVAAWGDTIEYEVLTGLGRRVLRQEAP